MGVDQEKFVLISGLMGSGKSTIVNEYVYEREVSDFTRPPVEAKFRGMDFEFVDQIFALTRQSTKYNFYELDAPTVNKWTQFIKVADAIIIVYNCLKENYYEDPKTFFNSIIQHIKTDTPLFFVVNNCKDTEMGKKRLNKMYPLDKLEKDHIHLKFIEPGEVYFSEKHGQRVKIDLEKLDKLYDDVINSIN